MKILRSFFALLITLLVSFNAYSQAVEICNNGIDDDFDGFIDCYDKDCSSNAACDGLFLGNDAKCSTVPPQFPQFTMTLDFASPNETTNHLSRMAVGDLDRDGMPEFITMNRYTKTLYILNGNDGSIKAKAIVPWEPYWEIAIANIDNDNCAEIFFIGYENVPGSPGVYLYSYDCNLNQNWRLAKRLPGDPINFGIADFDGDGKSELYAKDEIYDAHTGVRIVKTSASSYSRINGGPVAADILGDKKLELILGLNIYQVNLGARTADAGSLTLLKNRSEYFIRNEYNATSIADYNQDGFLDIIASGSETGNNKTTTIFYWDVNNDQVKTYRDLTGDYAPNGWGNGTGRVNIADLDGDGKLNASYVSGKYLYALKDDLTLLWRVNINEETSGYTGCTLFDFNGDGKSEIVYRDEQYLYIINGTDGSIYNQKTCISRTNREYPIVADVDADGSTELCVTCGFDDVASKNNFNNLNYSQYAHIRVFKSAAEPWVPARRLWNQHGYFVVNVNDDLTIPKELQKHYLVFSNGSCTQGPNRPLNKFLNQSPYLNSDGCPTYASPDIAFANTPSVAPPTCPDVNFTVSFKITNLGDVPISGNVPVTFYTKNPLRAGATKLNTINVTVSNFKPNDVFDVLNATVNGNGSDSLYIVLNDAGTTVPTPISLPNTSIFECDYDNILGVKVIPLPVKLTALQVNPNEKCTAPDNGSARAFIPVGATENTTDYFFYWSIGSVAKPIASADFIGPIYSGLPEGTYTIYARHKTANCNSDTVQVVIDAVVSSIPPITITVTNQTSCNPPNGKLEALVQGGNTGYTFEWFDNISSLGITTAVANGVRRGNYTVLVTKNGCSATKNAFVDGNALDPTVSATSVPVVNCQDPNTGSVSASVSLAGSPQPSSDYSFDWYFYNNGTSTRGSQLPPANGTGASRTGLAVGYYEVVATNNTTQCSSTSFVVQVQSQTVTPVVTVTELAPQTSCDPLNPNGRLQASVTVNGVPQPASDFTFEWYVGQNTLAANRHNDVSGVNGSIAEKIKGGGQNYTVKVISSSQCVSTAFNNVSETLDVPVIALTSTPDGICDPSLVVGLGSASSGSVTAGITYAGNPDSNFSNYTFTWYDGSLATGTPRTETSNSITSLNSGFFTLVVTRNGTSCQSIPQTAEVLNNTVVPVISTSSVPSTNCDPALANGRAIVTDIDGAGTGAPYAYQWHTGSTTALPISGATAAILSNQTGGPSATFTVLVTNQSNGCQNTATVAIADSRVIPDVVLAQTPNTICDAALTSPAVNFNGAVAATISNQVGAISNYVFTWRNGQLVTDPVNTSSISQTLIGLNSGYYAATAIHSTTGCQSPLRNIQVIDNTSLPAITASALPSTNCDPLLANGQASVTDVDGAGVGNPYSFQWHTGSTIASPIGGATSATLANQNGGASANFTVLVTNRSNGCQNTATVLLPDARAVPVVTLATTPNNICNPLLTNPVANFSGTATATISNLVGNYSDYSFEWKDQEVNGVLTDTDRFLNSIDSSRYSVVATHLITGCVSALVFTQVLNVTNLPAVVMNAVASTNCDPLLPNGQALVNSIDSIPVPGTGILAPYAFEWFSGNSTTTVISGATDGILENRQGAIGAFFTVRVTNQSNGCQNTAAVEVPDNRSLPIVTLTSSPNQNCVAPFNGTATVSTITYKGVVEPLAGYTFNWAHGPITSTASSLAQGTYQLRVTRTDVGCTSDPVQVDVDDDLYIPEINFSIANQTSCDPLNPNGSIGATIDETSIGGGSSVISGYTFSWVNNGSPLSLPGTAVGATPSVNNLPGNVFYSVTVQRALTGCTNTESIFLPEKIRLPRIELVGTDIVDCKVPGLVTARIFIDQNNDGDSSDPGDELTAAQINAEYSFQWFRGSSIAGPLLPTTTRVLNELDAPGAPIITLPVDSYTAIATSALTGCKTSDYTAVIKGPPSLFNVDFEVNNRPASCADTDGVVTAFVDSGGGVPAPFGDYTFQWFRGNPTNGLQSPTPSFYTDPVIAFKQPALQVDTLGLFGTPYPGTPGPQSPTSANTGPTLFGRASGIYSVVVERKADGCKEYKTVILPFLQEPVVILARFKPDECGVDAGEIEVELSAPNPVNQYLIQIYASANPKLGVDAPAKSDINPAAATGNIFTGLASGIYSVVARENPAFIPTGCFSSPLLVQMVESLPPLIDIVGSASNTTCVSAPLAGDGSIQVQVNTDPNDPFNASYPTPPPPTILQRGAAPFVTYSIGVKDAGNSNVAGYPTASTFVDGDQQTITGLRGEMYTITVTSSRGCVSAKTFDVPNAPRAAALDGNIVTLPALACDPLLETNASVEVKNLAIIGSSEICNNGIDDDGDGLTDSADPDCNDNLSDYRFDWFTDAALNTNILSAHGNNSPAVKGGEILSNVGAPLPGVSVTAGSYWVRAIKLNPGATGGVGCLSAPFKVNIQDDSIKPTANLSSLANTACDAQFEGSVKVVVTNPGSIASASYDYVWTSPAVSTIANGIGNGDGLLADDNFTGLSDGTYNLSFKNNASGCVGLAQTTVMKAATPIVVANATPVDQFICNPDGSINVGANGVQVGGVVDSNHSNFDFTWSRNNTTNIVVGPLQNADVLNVVNLPTIGADSYFVAVKKRSGLSPGSGCSSAPFRVDILDRSVAPTVSLTTFSNTACDTNFEGALRVSVTNPGSAASPTYNYTWLSTPAASPIVSGVSNGDGLGVDDNISALSDGLYSIRVTNNTSGCAVTSQAFIDKRATPIVITNATPVDQLICNPDGSITVGPSDIVVGGVVDSNHSNFDFTWSRNTIANTFIASLPGVDVVNTTNLPTIGADSYFVKVRRRAGVSIGSGCESAPFKVDILDKSIDPTVSLTPLPNTACDANFEGAIQVRVTSAGSVPSATYDYTWTSTPAVSSIVNGASNGDGLGTDDNFANLSDGAYAITVRNNASGCVGSTQAIITKLNTPIVIANASVVDQLICNPDGSITVGNNDILVNGVVDSNHNNFDFTWARNTVSNIFVIGLQGLDVINTTNLPTIGAGSYFVKVKKRAGVAIGSGCESAPFKVEIQDKSQQPDLIITSITPNSSCDLNNPNGVIQALASERSGPSGIYSFVWNFNGGTLPSFTLQQDISSSSRLVNAGMGQYTVEVTNTATNCKFSRVQQLDTNESLSLPNIVDISVVNPTNCLPQGSLHVVSLTIGGNTTFTNPPDDLDTDYDYEWYKQSLSSGLIAGEQNSVLSNQLPDTYFVKVRSLTTQCISAAVEARIDSTAIVYPVISITQLAPQIICTTNVGSGVLSALADGQNDTNPNYTFDWFNNLTSTGSSVANSSTISNLVAGDYSVSVRDLTTSCSAKAFFILQDNKDKFLPILSISSNPVTRCDIVDGSVFASAVKFPNTTNPVQNYPFNPYNYTADLYVGVPPADIASPEFPDISNDPAFPLLTENFVQNNLAIGSYTVRLTDNNTGCVTFGTVNIDDARLFPKPEITELAPVTNCTPADANGAARVLVAGKFVGYEFEWYEGNNVTGTPVYTGIEFSQLKADPIVYTIEATDLATGCKGTVQASIKNGTVAIPAPQIQILSHVTSCIFDNGALSASVNGVTKDYIFDWYGGKTENPPPDFIGEIYDSLKVGSYSVTATSVITGCKSPLVSADILMKQEFPEFDFQVTNASCDQPNGFATLFFTSIVGIGKIEWFQDNSLIASGPNLTNAMAGTYVVEATSELGCKSTQDVTVIADIRPRNGISRNGDAVNDYFHIDCIDQFLSNNVKIYNRAGTLVYEADGYDNSSIFFDGISNRGVSPIGTNLPDGTYFYIVDKRDGSKPVAGYLEIVK